jgi:predicted MFS family arabinose efflux permease
MENRWAILAVLFFVRTVMGFQFQSVASVAPLIMDDLNIDFAQFGILIGLYQLPGLVLAFPGGLLGRRFGDKYVVETALMLMVMGGLMMGLKSSYALAVTGRLLSGVGGVLLNVLLVKMIADWFAGKEIVTAMGILVSSWPFGISLALVSLGSLAMISSWRLVMFLTSAACLFAFILVVTIYHPPVSEGDKQKTKFFDLKFSGREFWLVTLAGLIWTLYNVGFIILPSFAPEFLTTTGYTIAAAGSLVSLVTWIFIPSIMLGGYVAERLGRPNVIMVSFFLAIGSAICLIPYFPYTFVLFIAIGMLFGPPAGIIMALLTEVLEPKNRAPGMGIFYTYFYGGMAALTALAGYLRDLTNNPAVPILFGGMLLFMTMIVLGLFRALQRRTVTID